MSDKEKLEALKLQSEIDKNKAEQAEIEKATAEDVNKFDPKIIIEIEKLQAEMEVIIDGGGFHISRRLIILLIILLIALPPLLLLLRLYAC